VSVNELVMAVTMAMDGDSAAHCAAADADENGEVSVNEVVHAVSNALVGCA